MRRIVLGARLQQELDDALPRLPTDRPVVQYIRQSTDEQVKKNIQSAILQDEKLKRRLVRLGWPDNEQFIIQISTDQGMSGQKRRDERDGLDLLYKKLEKREAAAVACYDVSRLYRDLTRLEYTHFINDICVALNVPVITYHRVYYPNKKEDMDALYRDFEIAAERIQWIHDYVLPAKMQAIEEAVSYGGGCVPFGYIVEGEKGLRYYTPYEPHAKLIRWLFQRFKELGGNLARLGRELRDTHFAFPEFAPHVKKPHVALQFDGQGYPVRTRSGLISILTNPAYLGWYCFSKSFDVVDDQGNVVYEKGRPKREKKTLVISKEAHTAIVDYDLFMYAYERLSPQTLDGEINELKPRLERRYTNTDALLEGVLQSNGNPVYVMNGKQTYVARVDNDGWKGTELTIRIGLLDSVFNLALRLLLPILDARRNVGLHDSLYDQLTTLQEEKAGEGASLEEQLQRTNKAIQEQELAKRVALEELYEHGVREATKLLKLLYEAKQALEYKINQADKEEEELAETKALLQTAIEKWEAMPFERKRRFIKLAVDSANIQYVSTHVIRVDIVFGEPISRTLTLHIYRPKGSKPPWEEEENANLRTLYPNADRLAILQALPRRTWEGCIQQSGFIGVGRSTRLNTADFGDSLAWNDVQVMKEAHMDKATEIASGKVLVGMECQLDIEFIYNNTILLPSVGESCRARPGRLSG